MSAEDLQLLEETVFDISIIKRDFSKINQQQGVNLNDSGKKLTSFDWELKLLSNR